MSNEARRAIEAILLVAEEPVPPNLLAQLVERSTDDVDAIVGEIQAALAAEARGYVIARVAGGYRFQTHPEMAPYIERFVLEGQTARLSGAALETLAIIAYKQPISRAQVAAIRGVSVDGVVRTLEQRGYIVEVARDPGPGNAILFGTTDSFLERLGLDSLDDLPPIAQFVPGADVVEQLEHGLRAEIQVEPPAEGAEQTPGSDEGAPDEGGATASGEGGVGGGPETAAPSGVEEPTVPGEGDGRAAGAADRPEAGAADDGPSPGPDDPTA